MVSLLNTQALPIIYQNVFGVNMEITVSTETVSADVVGISIPLLSSHNTDSYPAVPNITLSSQKI
jgi:hypothetical protein